MFAKISYPLIESKPKFNFMEDKTMTNTNTINVIAHKDNFLQIKSLLGNFVRRIEYPGYWDPSYLLVADVPDEKMAIISNGIKAIQQKGRR